MCAKETNTSLDCLPKAGSCLEDVARRMRQSTRSSVLSYSYFKIFKAAFGSYYIYRDPLLCTN